MADSLKASEAGRKIVDRARKRKGWTTQAPAWLDAAGGIAKSTLDRFRAGKPVRYENFTKICEAVGVKWQEIVDFDETEPELPQTGDRDEFIPEIIETWVGRQVLIENLLDRLSANVRVLAIVGISGQGKTALATKLATEEQSRNWQQLTPVNFDDSSDRDFVTVVERWLIELGESVSNSDRQQPTILLNLLVTKLRSRPYWLQLDSLEAILEGNSGGKNNFKSDAVQWKELFKSIVDSTTCKSRLVITSQDMPTQFDECKNSENWHCEELKGLTESDRVTLFESIFDRDRPDIEKTESVRAIWKRIAEIFEGHPFVIQEVAGEIIETFTGDVQWYWQEYQQEFETLAGSSERLEERVMTRINLSLQRLQQDCLLAYQLLLRGSVYRRSVPEAFWLALVESDKNEKKKALKLLKSRQFLNREAVTKLRQFRLRQHNLIRNVTGDLLRDARTSWQNSHRMAAQLWQTEYQPEPDSERIEQVRGLLEALEHYCEIEDADNALSIVNLKLDLHDDLFSQLQSWDYYREVIYYGIKYLKITQKTKNKTGEAAVLGNLGVAFSCLGDYQQALNCHNQSLEIFTQAENWLGVEKALSNLGSVYINIGEYDQAMDYYERCLEYAKTFDKMSEKSKALGNIGIIYNKTGKYFRAIQYFQNQLAICIINQDCEGQESALINLGNAYYILGQYDNAKTFVRQGLDIAKKLNSRSGKAASLGTLGAIYYALGNANKAIKYYCKQVDILQEIGDRASQARTLGNLGLAYWDLRNYDRAIDYHQKNLELAQQIGDLPGQGASYCNFGTIFVSTQEYKKAKEMFDLAIIAARKFGAPDLEATSLFGLSEVDLRLGNLDLSLENCKRVLAISTRVGLPLVRECQQLKHEIEYRISEQRQQHVKDDRPIGD